jgi:hypothetical protein
MMHMAVHLATGGAGFIGSHLAEELLRRRQDVRIVDNLSTGKRANLDYAAAADFIEGDRAEFCVAELAVAGIDYVLRHPRNGFASGLLDGQRETTPEYGKSGSCRGPNTLK